MTHQPHPEATSPATDYNPTRIRDAVRRLLDADGLPTIVQAGHPVLRQLAAPYDGQIDDAELAAFIERMRDVMHDAPPGVDWPPPHSWASPPCSWPSLKTNMRWTRSLRQCVTGNSWNFSRSSTGVPSTRY